MSIMTVTTRITRHWLERKTKSDLAQMYLDLLDDDIALGAERDRIVAERDKLKAQRDGLLVALKGLLEHTTTDVLGEFIQISRADHGERVAAARAALADVEREGK